MEMLTRWFYLYSGDSGSQIIAICWVNNNGYFQKLEHSNNS